MEHHGQAAYPDLGQAEGEIAQHLRQVLHLLVGEEEALRDVNYQETPIRWARWLLEYSNHKEGTIEDILSPIFPEGHQELVMVKDISFTAMCAHHLLPFRGTAAVGYIPDQAGNVVGLSKLARAVHFYAKRFTLQERITSQLADGIEATLHPSGVMVVMVAEHQCMSIRGVQNHSARTATSAVRGCFSTNLNGCKDEFLQLLRTKD